jgi:homoserine kinase
MKADCMPGSTRTTLPDRCCRQAARERALDVQFLHGALQDQGDARFLRRDVDQDVFVHRLRTAMVMNVDHTRRAAANRPASSWAVSYRAGP